MNVGEVLQELYRDDGVMPVAAIRAAYDLKEELTPNFVGFLEEVVEDPEKILKTEYYGNHTYALYLLAKFRESRAYPLLIRYARLPIDLLEELSGDIITEDFPRILASVCDGDLEPIKKIIEDRDIDHTVRAACLGSLQVLALTGKMPMPDYLDYLQVLLRAGLERKHSQVWNELVSEAVDVHAVDLLDDIRKAYTDGLVDQRYVSLDEVEDGLNGPPSDRPFGRKHGTLIDDVVSDISWWGCWETTSTPVSTSDKIGRNDPCPCESGKKYKKCCGKGK